MTSPYIFIKLTERQTRVLDLQPGPLGSPLQGSLRHISIDNPPPYEALSYTWGPSTTASFLYCSGSTIPLTLNLTQALPRLRSEGTIRALWIDQICINQNDEAERSSQVRLMGDIYRKAKAVNIWIGEEDDDTALALSIIPNILRCFNEIRSDDDLVGAVIRELGILFVKSPAWIALRDTFKRPYFRRVWIAQEVVLGPWSHCNVYCGSNVVLWENLSKAVVCLELDNERPKEAFRVVRSFKEMKSNYISAGQRPLVDLLSHTNNLQCTDPRDKVYGLLGLASDLHAGELVPDYGMSCQEVYTAVTRLCILKYQSLGVLCYVRNPKNVQNLPSWVPDWTAPSETSDVLSFRKDNKYAAAGTSMPRTRISADGQTLYVVGEAIDTIKTLGSMMSNDQKELLEWEQLTKSTSPYFTGETYPTTLWRTLLADGHTLGPESDQTRELFWLSFYNLTMRNRMVGDEPWEPVGEMSVVNSRAMEFVALCEAACVGRRLAITHRGYIDLVPADAEIGDGIYVLNGGHVPFLLRRRPDGSRYGLVGECYVQGWMDGRFFKDTAPLREIAID